MGVGGKVLNKGEDPENFLCLFLINSLPWGSQPLSHRPILVHSLAKLPSHYHPSLLSPPPRPHPACGKNVPHEKWYQKGQEPLPYNTQVHRLVLSSPLTHEKPGLEAGNVCPQRTGCDSPRALQSDRRLELRSAASRPTPHDHCTTLSFSSQKLVQKRLNKDLLTLLPGGPLLPTRILI